MPHKNNKYLERKFDWNNLFWSCGHCNSVKNQGKYDVGILDCCQIDPEEKIFFRLKDEEIQVAAKNKDDVQVGLTAELVTEVFNLHNTEMRVYKSNMRFRELNQEMNKLYDLLEEFRKEPASRFAMRKLRALLRRESRFAAFKRCYIKDNQERYPQLLEYIA